MMGTIILPTLQMRKLSHRDKSLYQRSHRQQMAPLGLKPKEFGLRVCVLTCLCICVSLLLFSSVAQLCPTLCDPIDCSTPGLPVHHQLLEFSHTHVHKSVMPSSHLILCHPLLPPSVFPSIRVFPSNSHIIRWEVLSGSRNTVEGNRRRQVLSRHCSHELRGR